jgi:hypothetical protein
MAWSAWVLAVLTFIAAGWALLEVNARQPRLAS